MKKQMGERKITNFKEICDNFSSKFMLNNLIHV